MKKNYSTFERVAQGALTHLVLLAFSLFLAACPRPVAPGPSSKSAPKSTQVTTGDGKGESTAYANAANGRLREIAAARTLLQDVIGQVPDQQQRAEKLQNQLREAKARLGPAVVDAAMANAAKELDNAQKRAQTNKDLSSLDAGERRAIELMRTALDVDTKLQAALAPLKEPDRALSDRERQLAQTVAEQQRALSTLATATRMAFRTLTVVEQLRRALPRLAKK